MRIWEFGLSESLSGRQLKSISGNTWFFILTRSENRFLGAGFFLIHSLRMKFHTKRVNVQWLRVKLHTKRVNVQYQRVKIHTKRVNVQCSRVKFHTQRVNVHCSGMKFHTKRMNVHCSRVKLHTKRMNVQYQRINAWPFFFGRGNESARIGVGQYLCFWNEKICF